jgi:hypothetical protein
MLLLIAEHPAMASIGGSTKGSDGHSQPEKKKKESIVDLTKFLEKRVCVKFTGKLTPKVPNLSPYERPAR